ncbi:MAG: MATE family efflux transporter [Firmicutes bacterium]|nr:MATE family efflux transporter [Candidatus Fermentithermobacillaceae bacterium]
MSDAQPIQATVLDNEPSAQEMRKTIFNLLWPATIESLLQMGIGLVNTAMVGHLSAVAIGAVGLSNRAIQIAWALFQAISTGTTVHIAQAIGANDSRRARTIAMQAILFGTLAVLVLAIMFAAFAPNVLKIFKPETALLSSGTKYMRIVVWGMPAVAIMTAIGASLRGSGDTRTPLVVAVFVNIVNVIGNWSLIYGNLGMPALGIAGSAIATVVAQWIGAIVAIIAISRPTAKLSLSFRSRWTVDRVELGKILNMGLPSAAESLFWQAAAIVLTLYITGFGTVALAAHQLGLNAESLSYMPTAGFSIAATTLVGQAVGAKNTHLSRRYTSELSRWALLITLVTASLLFFFPEQILALLTNDADVIALAAIYLRLMATAQIPQQVAGVLNGAIRGSGDTRTPMVVAAIGLWGVRLPLAYILAFPLKMGITGVWLGMTLDLFVRFILTMIRYKKLSWVESTSLFDFLKSPNKS